MTSIKKYLPSIVYGGSDGAVSYFTLMAGAYGAGVPIKILIAIGLSNVIADAFSMATADYLSEDSKTGTNEKLARKNAIVTFVSFVTLGLLPLIPTVYSYFTLPPDATLPLNMFLLSSLLTLAGFTYIGYLRGKVLNRDLISTIAQSIFICSTSAAVAYFIGEYLSRII